MSDLNIQQRLTLVKFLTEVMGRQRTGVMVPASRDEMPSGARMPAMFGGRLAAWVNMPQPKQRPAYVDNPGKLLSWARANYPDKVQATTEVVVTPELVEHLREHFPSALKAGEEADPQWVSDLCAALKEPGWYITGSGEKLTDVPGITLPEPDPPVPTVTLTEDAAAIIGAAWRDGQVPVSELLALSAGEGESDA